MFASLAVKVWAIIAYTVCACGLGLWSMYNLGLLCTYCAVYDWRLEIDPSPVCSLLVIMSYWYCITVTLVDESWDVIGIGYSIQITDLCEPSRNYRSRVHSKFKISHTQFAQQAHLITKKHSVVIFLPSHNCSVLGILYIFTKVYFRRFFLYRAAELVQRRAWQILID